MPISRDLNSAPYFDDFNIEKQYHRVLFKPSFAVQSRELIQLQTILQNQIEQFGDNIFQEGSIIKGCNFTELSDLQFVKVTDKAGFDVSQFVGGTVIEEIGGEDVEVDVFYELEGQITGLRAAIVAATRGFETRAPDLNTFYINYLNSNEIQEKVFQSGELLNIVRIKVVGDDVLTPGSEDDPAETINVTTRINHVGSSFGVRASEGIIFQKGHFIFAKEQIVIVEKYNNQPDSVSVGYIVQENIRIALQDNSLYDNASGSLNENAPGADRLQLVPILITLPTSQADNDTSFFTLIRYENGGAVQIRDVSQFNVIGEELAKRTYEESGDYITSDFKVKIIDRDDKIKASISTGTAYVKGYRVENKGEVFVDIETIEETAIQQNQPISFNYGGYVDITSVTGTVALNTFGAVNLQNVSSENIGTAIIKNITPSRLYLFDIRMEANTNFSTVTKIAGTSGSISIDNTVKQKSNSVLVFDTGMFSLKDTDDISLPVRSFKTGVSIAVSNTAQIVLNSEIGEDFAVDNSDLFVVDTSNTRLNISSIETSSNNTILTINLVPGQSPTATGTVYFNKRIALADPYTKISKETFIKANFSSSVKKYNLGFPDVYEILEILDADGADVTNSFRLKVNQKDHYYDHSYIELIPGRPLPAEGLMTVNLNVFKLSEGAGKYFFTVESYPNVLPANEIPVYTSESGRTYNLRDCFDFRPHVNNVSGADYDATVGTAPTIPATIEIAPTFTGPILIPAINSTGIVDYEFHLNRTDVITIDSYGRFAIIKGEESEKSAAPVVTDKLVIAELYIPGNPALSPELANAQNKPQYAVKLKSRGIKNYTMKDIQKLEDKIDKLKYYVLLSALETETRNLNITDENGLSRFKNGIIVDPFNDLNIANLEDVDYNAALDFTERSLTPSVKGFPLNLKLKNSVSATIFTEVASLSRNQNISVLSQKYATNFRNCVSNFYNYVGIGSISPEYDFSHDFVTNPVQINLNFADPIQQLIGDIQKFIPLTSTSSTLVDTNRTSTTAGRTTTTTTARNFLDTTESLQLSETIDEQQIGDFVTNTSFNPFMRSREIKIYMSGLRPNTQHYVFFDQVDVTDFTAPGTVSSDAAREIFRSGLNGAPLFADSNGVLRAIFTIPEGVFFVGDRKLEIVDVDVYANIISAGTSSGTITYRAYNLSSDKAALTISTRIPQSSIETTTTNRTVTNRTVTREPSRRSDRDWDPAGDPIAQTFFIKKGVARGADCIFASKFDLFFKRKSDINGVTVMLREVINGYPSAEILPFSQVHLTPAEVLTSDDASAITEILFEAPVRLDVEKEYAVVVMPDANDPDYLIYTSKVGGTDLTPGSTQGLNIIQDWGDGVLFTSTNNRAWQSYQDEDLKFTLYRHDFNESVGSITFTNDDHEFITIDNLVGKFTAGETVFVKKALAGGTSATVSVILGSNTITGTNLSDTYAVDDFILVESGLNKNLFKVVDITASTITADRPALFTGSSTGTPIVVGTNIYHDFRNPVELYLEGSSATNTKRFIANDTLYGFTSGAEANISSVDNINLSYMQPMIAKTNDSLTRTGLSGVFTDPEDSDVSYTIPMSFRDKTVFNNRGMQIFSKSNIVVTTEKPFDITISMLNGVNTTTSPIIDIETAIVFAYKYNITNDSDTTSKYISKTIELAENIEAEDFQLFVTAYRPKDTDVKAYIKIQNPSDPVNFDTNDWIELELFEGISLFSSSSNLNDVREYAYRIADTNKETDVVTYSNAFGVYSGYRKFAIKLELLSDNIHKAPRLLDYRGIALT